MNTLAGHCLLTLVLMACVPSGLVVLAAIVPGSGSKVEDTSAYGLEQGLAFCNLVSPLTLHVPDVKEYNANVFYASGEQSSNMTVVGTLRPEANFSVSFTIVIDPNSPYYKGSSTARGWFRHEVQLYWLDDLNGATDPMPVLTKEIRPGENNRFRVALEVPPDLPNGRYRVVLMETKASKTRAMKEAFNSESGNIYLRHGWASPIFQVFRREVELIVIDTWCSVS